MHRLLLTVCCIYMYKCWASGKNTPNSETEENNNDEEKKKQNIAAHMNLYAFVFVCEHSQQVMWTVCVEHQFSQRKFFNVERCFVSLLLWPECVYVCAYCDCVLYVRHTLCCGVYIRTIMCQHSYAHITHICNGFRVNVHWSFPLLLVWCCFRNANATKHFHTLQ